MDCDLAKVKLKLEIDVVDIPTMYGMTDDAYRHFVHAEGLVYIDHNGVLRSSAAGYPLATTLEQVAILIEELDSLRHKMTPRSG